MPTDSAAGPGTEPGEPAEAVGPLIRGLDILRVLTGAGGRLALPELSRESGLARSSVDRMLATLAALGYVRFHGREVVLAPRLMELGNAYLRSVRIPALLGPLARQLSERLDEVVTLTVTNEAGAFVVHEAVRPRKLAIVCHVGDHLPFDRCAGGALYATNWDDEHWERYAAWHQCAQDHGDARACADELRRRAERARSHGWALDDQWLEPGLIAVGIPVLAPGGEPVCDVNVLSFTSRYENAAELADAVLPALRETVHDMQDALRAAFHPPAHRDKSGEVRDVPSGPGVVESLARGLTMLTVFSETRPAVSIADGARLTGLPRATVRRALITLEHLGYVTQTDGRYRPNATVLSLGYPILTRLTLAQIATPHLETLSARVGHSASLAVLHDGGEIMYVARAAAARLTNVDIHIGSLVPAHATAMGRVLLASLPADEQGKALGAADPTRHPVTDPGRLRALLQQVRADGYAAVDEELEVGLRSIALPVHGHDGRTLAAVNVAMHAGLRGGLHRVEEILPPMRSAVQAIEGDLATIGPFHRIAVM